MKKSLILLLITLCVGFTYAQDKKEPKLEKKGDLTQVTYFHDNGIVEQKGAFDVNGKLQGEWTSFDIEGNKVAVGTYEAGKKVGKWFFWSNNTLREVDFVESKIANVSEWKNESKLAIN